MKFLALLALIPGVLLAAPLSVTVNLDGVSADEITVTSFFKATNPVCKRPMRYPNPHLTSRAYLIEGEVHKINDAKVETLITTKFPKKSFCGYRFDYANINMKGRGERISIFSRDMRDLTPGEVLPADILAYPDANLTAKCVNGRCQTFHNGSFTGYAIGHVANLYVDPELLQSEEGPTSEINLYYRYME